MARKIIKALELRSRMGGISNGTMHRYIADGTIPKPFKIGRHNAWFEDVFEAHIERLSASQAA